MKKTIALLLAAVMLLSLLPAGVLAAEGDVSVTLSGMHDAQVKSLKLYTYMDGVKGADDLLRRMELEAEIEGKENALNIIDKIIEETEVSY